MATWEKIKFFYDTMLGDEGSTLTATSTLVGTDITNLYNMLEVNRWEAADTSDPQYLTWSGNVLLNNGFETWSSGVIAYWSLSGAGATVARESNTTKAGLYSASLTRAGADCSLEQNILSFRDFLGKVFSIGAWVSSVSTSQARLAIFDGIKWSYSPYHSGGGAWEFLRLSHTVSEGATVLRVSLQVIGTDGTAFFDAASGGLEKSADYLAVMGHDFYGSGGSLTLEGSDDDFIGDIQALLSIRPLTNRAIVVEARLLANPDFEVWDNGALAPPTGWTLGGGPSVAIARETLTVFKGLYSARLSNALDEDGWVEAGDTGNPMDLAYLSSKTVSFACFVNTATPGRVTLRIYDDDGTGPQFTESNPHPGNGSWQFMTVTRPLRGGLKGLNLRCYISTGAVATAYIDESVFRAAPSVQAGELSDYVTPGSISKRHWRLKMTGNSNAPHMNICIWGDKTELDYATSSFDPYGERVQANLNISNSGQVMGVHTKYTERSLSLAFREADSTLYEKVRAWWERSGLKSFFVAWERGNNPDDIFLMFPDKSFSNPLKNGGLFRDINIKLKGRKE
ncbi:MAG: hypothetical protein ACE5EZ_03605 [Thermodesulfobacteriota bacterium]